jgi:hypothetical protein
MMDRTLDPLRTISGIGICNRRPAIRLLRRIDLRGSGRTKRKGESPWDRMFGAWGPRGSLANVPSPDPAGLAQRYSKHSPLAVLLQPQVQF